MVKGFSISIASETREFASGVKKGIIEPLEDAADILEDLGRNGGKDIEQIERAARDAQDKTDDVKKAFSDLQKEIRETGKKARTDFAKPMTDDLREVGGEAKSNAAEMLSSFDGSFDSIADAAQGTLGGLVGSLGGVGGAAIAAAGAAGLGLVFAELQKQEEAAKRLKEYLADAYRAAAEEGRKYIDQATIIAQVNDIQFNPDRAAEYEEALRDAKQTGVDLGTVLAARAGDQEALNDVIGVTRERYSQVRGEIESTEVTSKITSQSVVSQLGREAESLDTVASRYEGIRAEVDKNQQKAEQASQIMASLSAKEREQIQRTRDADQARYEAAASRYGVPLPTAVVPVKVDTAAADSAMREFTRRPYRVKVDIEGSLRNGQRII